MENGLVSPSVEGTPQGGPLSPLLSNLVLDELDRELECRGHRFVRRSAHQAVAQAQHYIAVGHSWVVDLDLEKFLDDDSYYTSCVEV